MAQAGSRYASPSMGHSRMVDSRSPSPMPQPLNKKDKKRAQLKERLSDMVSSFSNNNVDHYYAQLSAIQCDINLVLRADPYTEAPLEDSSEELTKLLRQTREDVCRHRPISSEGEPSFAALSGKYYAKFVDEVNAAMEERDKDLTMVYNQYQDSLEELRRTNQYKIQLAHEEHQLLSKTLRNRLVQNLIQKRARLLREKEQLDIADGNALLLNPNQFSIGNPASPGGVQNTRKTRHTRLRPADTEEAINGSVIDGNKRKRKALFDETDTGSPTPVLRAADAGAGAPFRDAKAKLVHSQFEAPAYSIDRLFTERELALNMSRAHVATQEFFARVQAHTMETKANGNNVAGVNDTANGNADLHERETVVAGTHPNIEAAENDEEIPIANTSPSLANFFPAPSSQNVHATRASHRANPLTDLANSAATLPYSINLGTTASRANMSAPTPPGVPDAEAQRDFLLMQRGAGDPLHDQLMEKCCEKLGPMGAGWWKAQPDGEHAEWSLGTAAQGVEGGQPLQTSHAATNIMARQPFAMGVGGVPMSKANSVGVMSEANGGTAMIRSISAADFGTRAKGRII